jgi:preprotein translocase subunit SecA
MIMARESNATERMVDLIKKELEEIVNFQSAQEEFDPEEVYKQASGMLPIRPEDKQDIREAFELTNHLHKVAEREYEAKEARTGKEALAQMERVVWLRAIDQLWQEHLDTMEHLRDSVRLRGYGQRDPLQEFKNEGFSLFQNLLAEINKNVAYTIFHVDITPQPIPVPMAAQAVDVNATTDIGRNDPCPCGSGKKFKKCGLLNTAEHQKLMASK